MDRYLQNGEVLCFSYAECEADSIDIIENGLVYMQQPKANSELKDSFNHDTRVSFSCIRRCGKLNHTDFRVGNCKGDTYIETEVEE